MNNGLEELDKLMETFYELCEECNCNEDMYQKHNLTSPHHIIRKKLERLEKLEKVVKILKKMKVIYERKILEAGICDVISNEECHLMIEVFGE